MTRACFLRKSVPVLSTVLVLTFAAAAYAAGPPYAYTRLRVPGSIYTDATGINNAGLVVGSFQDAGGTTHGYVFDGTTYTPVDYPGAVETYVFGIGPSGQVLGSYATTPGFYHAFVRDGSTFTSFDYPGGESDAQAINSAGDLLGTYDVVLGMPVHGFLKKGDQFFPIDMPGATDTGSWGINNLGVVTGTYSAAGVKHGFLYQAGNYYTVDFPGATETSIGGINNSNTLVGYTKQSGRYHGFVLSGSSYRSFDVDLTGAVATFARGINDAGQVVGSYASTDCPSGCGYLATPAAGTPVCQQTFTLGYAAGTLNLGFTLGATTPTTFSKYLFIQNTAYNVWTLQLPVLSPPLSFNVPLPLPPVGHVVGLSLLSTPLGGIICADIATVETGR